jgi:hypothetical protein
MADTVTRKCDAATRQQAGQLSPHEWLVCQKKVSQKHYRECDRDRRQRVHGKLSEKSGRRELHGARRVARCRSGRLLHTLGGSLKRGERQHDAPDFDLERLDGLGCRRDPFHRRRREQ